MAEERIICLQIGSHLRNCPLMKKSGYCILDCGCDQLEGIKCNKGFPRTEAIEKMAKAVCMRAMYGCKRCVFGKDKEKCEEWIAFNHIRDAEAALDGLLEDYRNE